MTVAIDIILCALFVGMCFFTVFRLTPKLLNDYLLELNPLEGTPSRNWTLRIWFLMTVFFSLVSYGLFQNRASGIVFAALIPFLFSLSYIDFKTQYLPDRLQVACLVLALVQLGIEAQNVSASHIFISRAIALTVPLSVLLIGYIYEKIRGIGGLGFGDIKLLAWMALFVETDVFTVLIVAIMLALIINIPRVVLKKIDSQTPFAFGPYIIISFFILSFLKGILGFSILQ